MDIVKLITGVEVKPIPGYENFYGASEDGRIWSYRRNRWLRPAKIGSGRDYLGVVLCVNGKRCTSRVHRLVAMAWIPNPNGLPCVNHKDCNRLNNNVNNLEWVSYYDNVHYMGASQKVGNKKIKVKCIETGEVWDSILSCARSLKINYDCLKDCVNGLRPTYHGLHFVEEV